MWMRSKKTLTHSMSCRYSRTGLGRHSQAGTKANCRYDVLVKNYDANARDLLIEVKPIFLPDKCTRVTHLWMGLRHPEFARGF